MNIYAYKGLVAGNARYKACTLWAYSSEGSHHSSITRKYSPVFCIDDFCNCVYLPRLGFVEGACGDSPVYFCRVYPAQGCRGSAELKEFAGAWDGHFIECADGDDACSEQLKRGVEALIGELKQRRFGKGHDRMPDTAQSQMNVKRML
jgi:hypothetical protein